MDQIDGLHRIPRQAARGIWHDRLWEAEPTRSVGPGTASALARRRRGADRLKARYVIAPLSNGNVSLVTNMAKHAGLPWDCILGADLARHYKPDPEVYQ